jgi:chaperonin GroEL (HSP60 family)
VVEYPKIVAGAGAIEIELSKQIRNYAQTISTRDSIAVESFARALESIPVNLSDNIGMNSMEVLADLLAKHEEKAGNYFGVDLENQKMFDAMKNGIFEPSMLIEHALSSATELSVMLLRIDETIASSKSSGGSGMPNPGVPDYDD